MYKYDIYGLGAALVDTEIEVDENDLNRFDIEKGVMTLVDEARQHQLLDMLEGHLVTAKLASGGSAANSIIAAQYFGASTFYSCKVADDEHGQFYLKDMINAGVDLPANCKVPEGITGKCLVMITSDAERTMNTFLGISETLSPEQLDPEALKASRFVYLEGYLVTSQTGKPAAIRARELAQEHGVQTALSLSDPGIVQYFHEGLLEIIGDGVDILFCNKAEALTFTGTDYVSDAVEKLKQYAKSFAITLGSEGSLVFDGEQQHLIETLQVHAVDTNCAGDMFAGAFLYAISQGQNYPDAAKFANCAAAKVVSQFGPRLHAEQHAEVKALYGA